MAESALDAIATVIVILCWPVYLSLFMGKSGPGTERRRKDRVSTIGIALQFAGAAVVWGIRRPLFSPVVQGEPLLQIAAPLMAVLLAAGSVWFSWAALKALGTQWSLVAGVTAEHRLIREGPFAIIRHPLYVCFFGLTIATGIVWSRISALPLASVLFWLGVWVRVRAEERILRETFGAEFDEYVRRVPAFFPLPRARDASSSR